ncbi:MAG: hypothetical protein JNJ83_09780 [Verrucomicrobiaceae bacterium]|nr:hypothetical protein [Verrucomicrobiaceae bacterium]
MLRLKTLMLSTVLGGVVAVPAHAVDFARQVFPILKSKCGKCHTVGKEEKGDFAVDRKEDMQKQVKAGSPDASSLIITITLPDDDDDVMPPKGKGTRVSPQEVALIKQWITEGASFEAGGAKPAAPAPAPATAGGGAGNTWTNTAGKTLTADFDRMEGDAVVVKGADGTYYKIPLANLSPESQAQAKKAAGM